MRKILDEYIDIRDLPVRVDRLRQSILDFGAVDQIVFYEDDHEPDELQFGMLRVSKDKPPYFSGERCIAEIYHPGPIDNFSVRLICFKELMHILDEPALCAITRLDVSRLISQIALPPALSHELNKIFTPAYAADRSGFIPALIVMVPEHIRLELKPLYEDDKITRSELSELFEVPENIVDVVMSDDWTEVVQQFYPPEE